MIVAETTVYFGTTRNAHSFFVEDFQFDALYWFKIWQVQTIVNILKQNSTLYDLYLLSSNQCKQFQPYFLAITVVELSMSFLARPAKVYFNIATRKGGVDMFCTK